MADHILRIENLSKSFEGNQIFSDVNFAVSPGELSAIIGPNGAGKTTLFNLITGYHVPDKGRIIFKGKDISGMEPFRHCQAGNGQSFSDHQYFSQNDRAGKSDCHHHHQGQWQSQHGHSRK